MELGRAGHPGARRRDARGHRELDDPRAALEVQPDRPAHLLRPVRLQPVQVAVPTGRADGLPGADDARARHQALGDRPLEDQVQRRPAARDADGGEAGLKRRPGVVNPPGHRERLRLLQEAPPRRRVGVMEQMDVGVDQSRQQGAARDLDPALRLRTRGGADRSHGDDAPVLHQHLGARQRRASRPVDQPGRPHHGPHQRSGERPSAPRGSRTSRTPSPNNVSAPGPSRRWRDRGTWRPTRRCRGSSGPRPACCPSSAAAAGRPGRDRKDRTRGGPPPLRSATSGRAPA